MDYRKFGCLAILTAVIGCSSGTIVDSELKSPASPAVSRHHYNGTASVGDFLNITVDTAASRLSYTNLTNGDSGIIPFTVNADGSYLLNDPSGNLTAAVEVPGYGLLVESQKAGPKKDTPALITAVESGATSMNTFSGRAYNYIQFRTSSGGLEIGSVEVANDSAQISSYWPYGSLNPSENQPFRNHAYDLSQAQASSSGTYLINPSMGPGPNGSAATGNDYIFGTANGFFIVDTENGSILSLAKAATKAFDAAVAGTYHAIYYQKNNAQTGVGNVETGTPSLETATIVIDSQANVTVSDAQGHVVTQAQLTPVADAPYLYGAGMLQDPCNGLFTFRIASGSSQQDVFVSFVQNAVVFASFRADLPWTPGNSTYDYVYGVGLK